MLTAGLAAGRHMGSQIAGWVDEEGELGSSDQGGPCWSWLTDWLVEMDKHVRTGRGAWWGRSPHPVLTWSLQIP